MTLPKRERALSKRYEELTRLFKTGQLAELRLQFEALSSIDAAHTATGVLTHLRVVEKGTLAGLFLLWLDEMAQAPNHTEPDSVRKSAVWWREKATRAEKCLQEIADLVGAPRGSDYGHVPDAVQAALDRAPKKEKKR